MSFLLQKNIKRPPTNKNFKRLVYKSSSLPAPSPKIAPVPPNSVNSVITICDKDIYKMPYNMDTIKKRVHQLFVNQGTNCYYFASIGITNLALTTYNEFIQNQAKLCFKILNDFEINHKITYAVFAGNSIGLLRAGKNLPWADDYDVILFKHDIDFFTNHMIPEFERIGFKVKIKIVDGIVSGAKIFGPPIVFSDINYDVNVNQSLSVFQCDIFFSYFDNHGFLKNCGGWGLYHEKNIPHHVVFPLQRRQFHGMLLPFFNDSLKEVELTYGNIQKCSIFSHHIDSTIFYQRWEHAYKDFDYIKKTAIANTRKYISNGFGLTYTYDGENAKKMLLLTSCDLSNMPPKLLDILFRESDRDDFHISVSKKLEFLRYLYQNNISVIVISPLISLQYNTNFVLAELKHKKNIDAADYNYNAPGLKIIGDHAADIKFYFPNLKIIYEESVDDTYSDECCLSPLFYNYIDIIRITKTRYEQTYKHQFLLSKKYGIIVPIVEIIQSN